MYYKPNLEAKPGSQGKKPVVATTRNDMAYGYVVHVHSTMYNISHTKV